MIAKIGKSNQRNCANWPIKIVLAKGLNPARIFPDKKLMTIDNIRPTCKTLKINACHQLDLPRPRNLKAELRAE